MPAIAIAILPRSLYNDSPPEPRSRALNNPTLLYSWWCTMFSLVVILFRVCGRYIRNERLFTEDKVMAFSIIPLMIRMGLIHVVLIFGTNNVVTTDLVDPVKIHHREIGSKTVLAARIFFAFFIWTAKFAVSEFLKRMTERYWKKGYEYCLRALRVFLVVTFFAVVISTLAECQPFDHYWQVVPDPGPRCRQGYAHLLTMGIADIITDILLVIFPIPIIFGSGMPLRRKISLVFLFSLSIGLIVITAARIPTVIERRGIQQFRTVMASSEILAATFVSNAIVLGSFLRDRGVKKPKYKGGSTTDSMDRRSSTRRPTLSRIDSDEHLARSLGYRTNPELTEERVKVARPAPVADLSLLEPTPFAGSTWQFPDAKSDDAQSAGVVVPNSWPGEDPHPSPRCGRRVSFFDAGGLLDETSSSADSPTDSIITHDFAFPGVRRPSRASSSLAPNARAHPLPRRSSRISQQSDDSEMPPRSRSQLQDLRAILSEGNEPALGRDPPATLPPIEDAGGLLSSASSSTPSK